MTRKTTSLFAQIITVLLDRATFARIVRTHHGDKRSKWLRCTDQLIAMLFLHLGKVTSLRGVRDGLRNVRKDDPPRHAEDPRVFDARVCQCAPTLGDLSRRVFATLEHCRSTLTGGKRFRFKNRLLSMDATFIDFCLDLFPWANYRQTKGAVKIHMLLDHDGYFPVFADITDGKRHDSHVARQAVSDPALLPPGSIVVFDRGYMDFRLFAQLSAVGVSFVIRLKEGMNWRVVEHRAVPKNSGMTMDVDVRFEGRSATHLGQQTLRLVTSVDRKAGEVVRILTNNRLLGSTTIARIFRDRCKSRSISRRSSNT